METSISLINSKVIWITLQDVTYIEQKYFQQNLRHILDSKLFLFRIKNVSLIYLINLCDEIFNLNNNSGLHFLNFSKIQESEITIMIAWFILFTTMNTVPPYQVQIPQNVLLKLIEKVTKFTTVSIQ